IRLFLAWLDLVGIPSEDLRFRLQIHEGADVEAALGHWAEVVDAPMERFLRPILKRHNPKTRRKNVGASYVGCLLVLVPRSTDLNSRIEGWFRGIVTATGAPPN
ncbi:MAG TPA: hypothetical protein VF097_03165, partial [Actinomycetota bacterium]